jgi:hypothetical protein
MDMTTIRAINVKGVGKHQRTGHVKYLIELRTQPPPPSPPLPFPPRGPIETWEVRRRYSELLALHNAIKKLVHAPGLSFPKKTFGIAQSTTCRSRCRKFDQYFQKLVSLPDFNSSAWGRCVQDFLQPGRVPVSLLKALDNSVSGSREEQHSMMSAVFSPAKSSRSEQNSHWQAIDEDENPDVAQFSKRWLLASKLEQGNISETEYAALMAKQELASRLDSEVKTFSVGEIEVASQEQPEYTSPDTAFSQQKLDTQTPDKMRQLRRDLGLESPNGNGGSYVVEMSAEEEIVDIQTDEDEDDEDYDTAAEEEDIRTHHHREGASYLNDGAENQQENTPGELIVPFDRKLKKYSAHGKQKQRHNVFYGSRKVFTQH